MPILRFCTVNFISLEIYKSYSYRNQQQPVTVIWIVKPCTKKPQHDFVIKPGNE